jgi:8-oxo-dGTP pyrophosphatase MutT (NUDIX family)
MKEYNFCNNCGKHGHLFHQCKNPITSLGIIVFNDEKYREDNSNDIEYLMIRRKDSLGYVDFMRGKYPLFNKRYLLNIINEMTDKEKLRLLNKDFDELWDELWGDYVGVQYRGEEKTSNEKFNSLKIGITLSHDDYNLESLIKLSKTGWRDPEWGFAKGRRNFQEKDLNCALREFEEETGYNKNSLKLIQNLIPIEEIFSGSNYKSYKHKYYLAFLDKNVDPIADFQKSEVSKVKWLSYSKCVDLIRPYNLERINVLTNVNNIIKNYNFF